MRWLDTATPSLPTTPAVGRTGLLVIADETDLISHLRDEGHLLDRFLIGSRPREHVRHFRDPALFGDFHDFGAIRFACLVLHRVAVHADPRFVGVGRHLAIEPRACRTEIAIPEAALAFV